MLIYLPHIRTCFTHFLTFYYCRPHAEPRRLRCNQLFCFSFFASHNSFLFFFYPPPPHTTTTVPSLLHSVCGTLFCVALEPLQRELLLLSQHPLSPLFPPPLTQYPYQAICDSELLGESLRYHLQQRHQQVAAAGNAGIVSQGLTAMGMHGCGGTVSEIGAIVAFLEAL